MTSNEFVYTTYIKTTPEKVWSAITTPEFTRQYWGGYENISDWKKGSQWQHLSNTDRKVRMVGEILESTPPKRLVMSWVNPEDATDHSRVTFEIEAIEDMVRLNVTHGDFKPGSDMPRKISGGWPRVLSSMKSFLETGKGLNVMAGKESDCGAASAKGAAA